MNTRLSYETTPLKDGLRKTYEWYLENEWWPLIDDKFFKEDEPWK
jgi:dTDP-glucose 4,6-dehydratase